MRSKEYRTFGGSRAPASPFDDVHEPRRRRTAVAVGLVGLVATSAVLGLAVRSAARPPLLAASFKTTTTSAPETDLSTLMTVVVDGNRLWGIIGSADGDDASSSRRVVLAAGLDAPQAVALMSNATAYVTDRRGLRRVDLATGRVTTVIEAAASCDAATKALEGEPATSAPPFSSVAVDAGGLYFVARKACMALATSTNAAAVWGIYTVTEDEFTVELLFEPADMPTSLSLDDERLYWTADEGLDEALGYVVGRLEYGAKAYTVFGPTAHATTTLLDGLPSPRYLAPVVDAATGSLYVVCEKSDLGEAQIVRVDVPRALASSDAVAAGRAPTYDKSNFDAVVSKADAGYPTALALGADDALYFPDAASATVLRQALDPATGLAADVESDRGSGVVGGGAGPTPLGGADGVVGAPKGIAVWPTKS
eukprot:CAMPEP_0185707818 /NCGR_PEP_ID=MMETSP1164-20130828/25174_1 /TAXON_ID=1104430 /ORGANISM="Chrysoreinhardia sp, Strain CCMP2950" /LENGTH=423 /DNA_ID=CAMNT_0028375255 /DNA_START=19 /DNA_END=1290 /DNA_ORIENTATION=+